jgi:hypothetical protein
VRQASGIPKQKSQHTKHKRQTARERLQISQLHLSHKELLGHDLDVHKLLLKFGKDFGVNIAEAILSANVQRTVEGASTFTIEVEDRDRVLLRSGFLTKWTDVQIDGLWFRLVSVSKSADVLTLTFEDREIAVLRTYTKIIKASRATSRDKITRAEFILRMILEVKEFKIPWVIPELEIIQPLEDDPNQSLQDQLNNGNSKNRGIPMDINDVQGTTGEDVRMRGLSNQHKRSMKPSAPKVGPGAQAFGIGINPLGAYSGASASAKAHMVSPSKTLGDQAGHLKVKGQKMSRAQIKTANTILNVGDSMTGINTRMMVEAIMCSIQESNLTNYKSADSNGSSGAFQQTPPWWGTRAQVNNVAHAARKFFEAIRTENHQHPNIPMWENIYHVQKCAAQYMTRYQQWFDEAQRIVTAYGGGSLKNNQGTPDTTPSTADYEFYRGVPTQVGNKTLWTPENSWDCIQRLAQEVNWRAFFVSGTFFYVDDQDLYQAKPIASLGEFSRGIEGIDGDYDEGKHTGELTISARVARWAAPPGSVIQVKHMGPWNGRWLVTTIERDLFDDLATITLKKPEPQLPEPFGEQITTDPNTANPNTDGANRTDIVASISNMGILTRHLFAGVDQGVDFTGRGPVPVLDDAVITNVRHVHIIEGGSWPLIAYRLKSGPKKGRYVYLMENIKPKVRKGQHVKAGTVIAEAVGKYPYIEIGFASDGYGSPAAPLGGATALGQEMWNYIQTLGNA